MGFTQVTNSRGFTLVELLVSIVVASLVVMAATTTFIVQNRLATVQAGTSDIQLTGQLVIDLMTRDIRMAGYGVDKSTALETSDNASSTDPLRSVNTDAVQIRYSTPVLATSPAGTRGTRKYNYYIAKTGDGGLVRQDLLPGGTTETIASNVEDMQISSTTDKKTVTLTLKLKSMTRDPGSSPDSYPRRTYTVNINPRNYGL